MAKGGFEDRDSRANKLRLLVNFFHVWIVCPAISGLFDSRPTKRFRIRSRVRTRGFDLYFHYRLFEVLFNHSFTEWNIENDCKIFETEIFLIVEISNLDEMIYPSKIEKLGTWDNVFNFILSLLRIFTNIFQIL